MERGDAEGNDADAREGVGEELGVPVPAAALVRKAVALCNASLVACSTELWSTEWDTPRDKREGVLKRDGEAELDTSRTKRQGETDGDVVVLFGLGGRASDEIARWLTSERRLRTLYHREDVWAVPGKRGVCVHCIQWGDFWWWVRFHLHGWEGVPLYLGGAVSFNLSGIIFSSLSICSSLGFMSSNESDTSALTATMNAISPLASMSGFSAMRLLNAVPSLR